MHKTNNKQHVTKTVVTTELNTTGGNHEASHQRRGGGFYGNRVGSLQSGTGIESKC